MSGRVTAESLCEALDDLGFESSDVEAKAVDRMLSLCDLYNIDADKITEEYLAFLTNRKIDFSSKGATPTIPLLDALDRECLSKLEAKRREDERRGITDVSSLHLNNAAAAAAEEDEEQQSEMALAYGIKTPVHSGKRSTASSTPEVIFKKRGPFQSPSVTDNGLLPMTPNAAGKYAERTKKGETVITYNVEMQAIADWKTPDGDTNAVSVSQVASERPLDKPYRFMFEGLREKASCLDETICRLGDHLAAKNSIEEEPHDFFQAALEEFVVLGRVCCDATDGGRINAQSILLQGSQDITRGRTIPLSVAGVGECSLFPGQIVMAEVTNPNGNQLVAKRIYADASPPLLDRADRVTAHPVNVVMASGPFTTSDNLDFSPLKDLLASIVKNKPHVAVLTGPFLDARHNLVSKGETGGRTYAELFAQEVMVKIIEASALVPATRFVLVSNHNDVHHRFIYPTPPFPTSAKEEVRERIHMMPDPCVFSVDGVVFAVTSTDVLRHLGKEYLHVGPRCDRIKQMAAFLVQQRSFYPLFPPDLEDMANVDYEKLESHGQLNVRPHVLVAPSDLLHFYKDLGDGCLAVNPGRLAKGEGGGVFARLRIRPASKEDEPLSRRMAGDIVRI